MPTLASDWDLGTNQIIYRGSSVQLQGFAVTCLEYLLRGIGSECMAQYNWADPSNLIVAPNPAQVEALLALLLDGKSNDAVLPTVRFSLNAAYWLDVETSAWKVNRATYPGLSRQYHELLDELVESFTGAGVAVILDLHWNDDVTEQRAMALRAADWEAAGNGATGDSVAFWDSVAQRYGGNPLVLYELYNEPFDSGHGYDSWLNGGNGYEGMRPMYDAVRAHTTNPIVLAGQLNYAYDAESLVRFEADVSPTNVLYNLHPYMGPYQKDDSAKNIDGYEQRVERVLTGTGRPLIITEFGQYCCAADGACFLYPGQYDGQDMGFTQAVLTVNMKYGVSWTAWAWRPNQGAGQCLQPDANDGTSLYNAANHDGEGANWNRLFPLFYDVVTSA